MMDNVKVLIVDDEEQIFRGLRVILEETMSGFIVAGHAKNGEEAIFLMNGRDFDIVITDIRMPHMDGIELVRQIRLKSANIPIVVLSGYGEYEYMRASLKQGVTDYLLKPINRMEFTECLTKLRNKIQKEKSLRTGYDNTENNDSWALRKVKEYVEDHLSEDITLTDVASIVNYSYNYISALFSKETGITFSEYLVCRRIDKAKQLLKESRLKIYEIAWQCGYDNTKYFMSLFKERTNQTPSEFRKSVES